jgi:hypothetical protein
MAATAASFSRFESVGLTYSFFMPLSPADAVYSPTCPILAMERRRASPEASFARYGVDGKLKKIDENNGAA